MKVIGIAAVGKNGVIGKNNGLPWDIPEDMKFFRESTRGQIVIMGRKSFDSIGKPLPNRENAVITRDPNWGFSGVKRFSSLDDAIQFYKKSADFQGKNAFILGGGEIFKLAYPLMDEIWLTQIDHGFDGDVFFPEYRDGKLLHPDFELSKSLPQTDFSSTPHTYFFNFYVRK